MTVTSSGAAAVDRRTLLRLAGLTAGAGVVATAALPGSASAAAGGLQHGVASGDPLPGGILLWTRVTPPPESAPAPGVGPVVAVDWQVAPDASFVTVVSSGTV